MDWISVDDRLPEKGDLVNIVKGGAVVCGFYDGEWWDINGRRGGDVTHWMPLPEPPKPKGPFYAITSEDRRTHSVRYFGVRIGPTLRTASEAMELVKDLNGLWPK